MGDAKKREFALGLIILVAGLAYLFLTNQLPRKQSIDAAFVPYVLASIMCVLGVLQLRAAWSFVPKAPSGKSEETVDYATVMKTVGLVVGYVALMEYIGFPIMTVLYLMAQFVVLTPVSKKVNYVLYTVIAVISSAVIFLTFRYAFDMMLPVGLLDF
jgi:putative tricarboxylic transport membrane protein